MSKKEEKKERNLTEERKLRCEPIAKEILEKYLSADLLLADVDFIEQLVKEQFEALFKHIVFLHANETFQLVSDSLNFALEQANKSFWEKDKDEISVTDVDKVLRSKKEV